MWFTPGMATGAILVYVTWLITGTAGQWWLWLTAVLVSVLIDITFHYVPRTVPKYKTQTVYEKEE